MDPIEELCRLRTNGARGVEVVHSVHRDLQHRHGRRKSLQPEVDIAARTVQQHNCRMSAQACGFQALETDRFARREEGYLHGRRMRFARYHCVTMSVSGLMSGMVSEMVTRLAAGDVRALARAISIVEDDAESAGDLLVACRALGRRAIRIGITGAPGAGKSTLTDAMAHYVRSQEKTVSVVAIDPTSPYTGGALLGDRIRMQGFTGDPGVFIRSMASRGEPGGLSRSAADICTVLEAAGFDYVIVETVGVGQDAVAVVSVADVTMLVLVPGMGDDVQSLKAGVMEAANIFAVNKSDLGGADKLEAELLGMQSLASEHGAWIPPVLRTVATSGSGISKLLEAAEKFLQLRQSPQPLHLPVKSALRIDHVGIAVRSIASAQTFYESLGLRIEQRESIPHEGVTAAMLPLGDSRLELLEPVADDSTISRFLARRGEGLHHVAVRVDRLDERFADMQASGTRLASDRIRVGAGGHRYFFVHPESTGGVLVELVGE